MSFTVTWAPDPPANGVASYTLDVSIDGAATWTNVAVIMYSLTGPNYDKTNKVFTYTDTVGALGSIYRLSATGTYGTSGYVYIVSPPATPALCTIIGYQLNTFALVDTDAKIYVEAYGALMPWISGTPGTVGTTQEAALGIQAGRMTVSPNASGIWQVALIQGTYAKVSIPSLNYELAFQVPAASGPINIRDIRSLRGADFFSVTGQPRGVPVELTSTGQ